MADDPRPELPNAPRCLRVLFTRVPVEGSLSVAQTVLMSLNAYPMRRQGRRWTGEAGSARGRLLRGRFTPTSELPVRLTIAVDDLAVQRRLTISCEPLPHRLGAAATERYAERCDLLMEQLLDLLHVRLRAAEQVDGPTPSTSRLGRYELRGVLGRGGFATVYRAWDPGLEREVALKVLSPQLAADREYRERFLREARALAAVRHPNIVTVYEVNEHGDELSFAMELVSGPSAADLVAGGAGLPLSDVATIVGQVASALDFLHAHGIIHRDVKDTNVMLDADGRAVLMDLGIALLEGRTRLTVAGPLGTPEVAAPEQIEGRAVGPAADIYALGVLAYELLAGRLPFSGDLSHVLYAQVHEPPPALRTLRPDLPEALYAAINAALAKDPSQRPGTATALARALDI